MFDKVIKKIITLTIRQSNIFYCSLLCRCYLSLFFWHRPLTELIFAEIRKKHGGQLYLTLYSYWALFYVQNSSVVLQAFKFACRLGDSKKISDLYSLIEQKFDNQALFFEQRYLLKVQPVFKKANEKLIIRIAKETPYTPIALLALTNLVESNNVDNEIFSCSSGSPRSVLGLVDRFLKSNEVDLCASLEEIWANLSDEIAIYNKFSEAAFNQKEEVFAFREKKDLGKLLGQRLIFLLGQLGYQRSKEKVLSVYRMFIALDLKKEAFLIYQYMIENFQPEFLIRSRDSFNELLSSIVKDSQLKLTTNCFLGYSRVKPRKKIAVLTTIWKRHELTKFILKYYRDLFDRHLNKFEFCFVVVGSENDVTRTMVDEFDFHYVESPNTPLSFKWQAGLDAVKVYDPDALLIIGSDDIISDDMLEEYYLRLNQGYLVYGLKDFAVVSSKTSLIWGGYSIFDNLNRYLEPIGAGKLIAKPILKALNFKFWHDEARNKGLDGLLSEKFNEMKFYPCLPSLSQTIQVNGEVYRYGQVVWSHQQNNTYLTDIKVCDQNITPAENFKKGMSSARTIKCYTKFVAKYYGISVSEDLREVFDVS